MRLLAPCQAADFSTTDIYGEPFQLSNHLGKPIILSFFRDASCPFCNFRVYEYTQRYKRWQEAGVEVISVFSSPAEDVRKFVAKHPRPFPTLADPDLVLYNHYGIESSRSGFYKALFLRIPTIIKGMMTGGRADPKNPNPGLMPADFLIGFDGRVVKVWYGNDASDHIPMKQLEKFVEKVQTHNRRVSARKSQQTSHDPASNGHVMA